MNSPRDLIESQFPSYFLEQYPQFVKFIEEYYDFLESSIAIFEDKKNCKVGDVVYGSLSKAKAIVKIIAGDKIYFDYETENNNFYKNEIVLNGNTGEVYYLKNLYKNIYSFARDIEENTAYDTVQNMFKKYFKRNISLDHSIFSRLDPKTLTKKILDYYKNRGTENSYYWFFRIFFDDVIDLYYPKVDILRLSDTHHIEKRWIQIKYEPTIVKFEKTRIIGNKSKATATVRRVQEKSRNNQTKAYLDLIYVNGTFLENETITGYDIITGEKIVTGTILPSIIGVNIEDGGIGHKVGDEFTFHDGIGQVTHLEKYSVTNINILNPGHFYSVGNYIDFDNQYIGATAYANAYVSEIEPNYALSDYVNFVNNTLKYNPVDPYEPSDLLDYLNSNTFANTNLYIAYDNPYTFIGSIKSIKIDKSGLNYRFTPNVNVVNPSHQAQNLYLFNLFLETTNANTNFLPVNSIVALDGEPAVYAGPRVISEDDVYFEDIDVLAEDPYVDTFYGHKGLIKRLNPGTTIEFFANTNPQTTADILLKTYDANTTLSIEILNYNSYEALGETARITSELGDGVSKIKITDPGMLVEEKHDICFIKGPEKRQVESNNVIHHLDTTFSYKHGVIFDPIEEFKENNSNLSSEKHIQDNFYYQSFSYEITTKIPADLIEPLLLDELHPAGFIAFIRNKIDEEVSMHLKAYEFPRIEIEAEGAKFEQEVMPYMVQMQEQFHNMNRDEVYWDAGFDSADYDQLFDKDKNLTFDGNRKKQLEHLYTFVEVNNTENVEIEHLVEQELENNDFIDVFEGFRLYVEDCLIRPDSKSFQEFRKCDDGPYFSWLEKPSLITFDDKEGKGNSAFFDNDGTCIPTGYGTSYEFSRLEQEYMNYDGHVAIESFMQLILLEDEANWKTDPIGRYKGTIGERRDYVINNHKAVVQDIIHIATNRNVGGKIVVRDWLGEASKFRFDAELIYLDANNDFDITKNFSGEFYNYTPNMVWYFDNTDANNIIDDFSNINTINPLCYTPYHVHNSFNFSNVPATGYIPIVSGNTLANKGSYLPTTEVLTRDKGYLPIKDIKLSDHVAFVKDNGKIIWRKPDDIKRENYKGVMYNFTDYNRMSVTVTPDQDLVLYDDRLLPHTIKARKIKSDRINLPRFINDSFGLVDVNLAGTPNKALLDYIPVDERIHKNVIQYDGDVYCLIFNEYREFIPVQNEITNVDLHLLQLASEINNDYTLPKFEPIHINYTNHDKYEHHVKIDIERRDTILYLGESNTIIFDFNTANEEGKYVTFVPEFGISNVDTIKNTLGPRFDHAKNSQTFDDTGGYGFDHTAERFRVNPLTTYYDLSYAITKPPVGVEQALVKQHSPNGFASYFETTENYLNKNADGNNIGVEIFTYNMDHHTMKEFGGKPNSTLITEVYELLYPEQFGLEVTFDIANLSPPGCKNGFFDYVGNDDAIFKFDSNTANTPIFNAAAGLTFDYGKEDHCNYDSLPFDRLGRFNTYDTNKRSWDQTHDYITKTHQYIEPEQILNNSADQFLVANNENSASVRNMHPPSEQVLIRETQGSAIVATIKNYRVDLKKKFFDSVIWEFDRNYNFSVLNPLEHSGFDSTEESEKVNYRCINLFFDNDDLYLTNSTLGFVSRDIRPTSFDKESYYFRSEITTFDRQGWLIDDCEVKVIPFPFDDVHKNIATHLINHDHVQGYGPYGYSGSFDSSIPGHGFDRRKFPFFDNAQGNLKPFVRTEPTFINFDSQDIMMVHERTDVQLINHDDLRLYPQEEYCLDVTFDIENLSSIQYRNGFFDYVGTDGPIFFDGIVKYDFSHEGTPFSREGWLSVNSLQNLIPIAYTFDSNEVRTSSKNLSMDAIYLDDTAEYDFALESISYDRIGWLSYADDINGISFDYDSEHPNYDSLPESRLRENNTFDTEERNFAQTYDCITKYRQYVEPEQTLINWAQIVICVKDYITEDDVIKDFQFSVIYPYLTDQGCDPSSTKGTNATVDQNLINAPIEYMDTEISEIETIIYNPVSFIDGSLSDAHTNHLEVEIYTDIFSCDPIRYTDIIYEHRRARIQPFIDDLCPGDKEKMLFYETDFEFILMNEDTYFANTELYENYEIEIYSHQDNHLYPNAKHVHANNVITTTFEYAEIEVSQNIGNRNCVISTADVISNFVDTDILPCHLKEEIRYWVWDSLPSVKQTASTVQILEANTEIEFSAEPRTVFVVDPRHMESNTMYRTISNKFEGPYLRYDVSDHAFDEMEMDISILDKNPYIWDEQRITANKLDSYIIPKMLPKEILEYAGDKIQSVTASQVTDIDFIKHLYGNSVIEVNTNTVRDYESEFDATSDLYDDVEIDYSFNIYDRNPYINLNKKIDERFEDAILSNMLAKPMITYEKDLIPSVSAKIRTKVISEGIGNVNNYVVVTHNTYDLGTKQIDATMDSYENPEIDYKFDVYDRNPYISVFQKFDDLKLDDIIIGNLLGKPIIEYDGDLIPSVKAWAFNEIETQFIANGSPFTSDDRRDDVQTFFAIDTTLYQEPIFVDATSSDDAYQHNEIEEHEFIADRNMIVSLDQPYALKLDRLILSNMLGKPIVEYDGNYIPSVTVDSRPSFKHFRSFKHNLQSNTFPYTVTTLPERFIDATTYAFSEFDEVEDDSILINDLEFLTIDDSIAKNFYFALTDEVLRRHTIRNDRYDTVRAMRLFEQHEMEMNYFIGPNPILQKGGFSFGDTSKTFDNNIDLFEEIAEPKYHDAANYEINYSQDTILSKDDASFIDATTYAYVEFDETEHDNEVCDLFSIIPLDKRILGTRWEKEYIFDSDLKRPIVDYSKGCIPSVTVDSTPSIQTNRTEYHDLPSSITHEFIYYFPEVLPIDATTDNIEFDELEMYVDIPDRYKYLNINDSIDGLMLSSTLDEYGYLDKLLTDYDKFAIPTVHVERMPYLEIEEHHYIGPNPEIQIGGTFNDAGPNSLTFDNNRHKFEEITNPKYYGANYEIGYKQDFILKFADTLFIDATIDGQTFGETESSYDVLSMHPYFDLTDKIGEFTIFENNYGDHILDKVIDDKLISKLLTDYSKDKTFVNIVTQEPHIENHVEFRPNYIEYVGTFGDTGEDSLTFDNNRHKFEEISRLKYTGPNYEIKYDQETIRAFADIMFDATVSHLNIEGDLENIGIVHHKRNILSLADQVRPGLMFEKLDLESTRRLIPDRSYHDPGADIFDPRLERIYPEYGYGPHVPNERSLPLENKKQLVGIENIISSKDFEKFIDSTMLVNDGAGEQTVDRLIESMFANVEMIVFEAIPTIINRPVEKTEISAFLDTIIMGEQFEKFIDSSTKEQEIFTHLNLNQFADFKMNANSVLVEGNLINRPHEYANTAPKGNKTFIDTILKGEYFEKFIDSNSKVVSELFEYTPGRANVVLKDLADIPWFSTNVSNISYSTLNSGWSFSTNSQNTSTNTIVYFSTAGPDYQVDLKPTYIDMAFATQNTYAIPSANSGYLNANGWQYDHQQDALPIPTANLQFESNRKIRMAVFEKFEFYITDIANTHNGYYFAIGSSPWFDDNREANVLFGMANGVTYELDGNVYTNFNQYKADFTSGLKANAKITFAPTISLAQLLGSDANSVNGASSDLCPTYNVYSANTYTFYYWSNANNTIFSAGGDIEIYELNNLEECIDYSINKTSYIDNIRVSKEVMFA